MSSSQKESFFYAGWFIWAIFFVFTFGWTWMFGNPLIPSDSITYYENGTKSSFPTLLGTIAIFWVCGWPLLGWVTLS